MYRSHGVQQGARRKTLSRMENQDQDVDDGGHIATRQREREKHVQSLGTRRTGSRRRRVGVERIRRGIGVAAAMDGRGSGEK